MTIWNPQEWEEVQKLFVEYKELLSTEVELKIRQKCLIDRAWNTYYQANKYSQGSQYHPIE